MAQMKTPGVYIVEKNAFPSSVVEVATAVPAFIGYTEKAENEGKTLLQKPWRITSMAEYHTYFGGAPAPMFDISNLSAANPDKLPPDFSFKGTDYGLKQTAGKYLLYYSLILFYANGGGACYIVSVGNYSNDIQPDALNQGIELLKKEQEPMNLIISVDLGKKCR